MLLKSGVEMVFDHGLDVLDLHQRDKWMDALETAGVDDVYFLPEYLQMVAGNGDGIGKLAVYSDANGIVVYPFVLRKIECADKPDDLNDIASPYGYSGPIVRGCGAEEAIVLAESFRKTFHEYCVDNSIVSEFIRFHPLLENRLYFATTLKIEYVRDTVVVDLTRSCDEIWAKSFEGRVRTAVRKAIKADVQVSCHNGVPKAFTDLYYGTMERLGADEYYFFNSAYFHYLDKFVRENGVTMVARYENKAIASAIFLNGSQFAHYHLSASDPVYRSIPSTTLLIWEGIKWAKSQGLKFLHLGGGYSGNDDTLFKFKEGFSHERRQYYVGKVIHMGDTYKQLTNDMVKLDRGEIENNGFFPLYRLNC